MGCKVKSGARAVARRAEREFRDLDRVMDRVVRDAAQELRRTDPYQDRTTNLRNSTVGETMDLGGRVEAVLVMGMFYASFVNRLGYSNFDEVSQKARRRMREAFTRMARRITRG